MKDNEFEFVGNENKIRVEGDFVNLDDIYALCGSPPGKDPSSWLNLPSTKKLIEALEKKLQQQ